MRKERARECTSNDTRPNDANPRDVGTHRCGTKPGQGSAELGEQSAEVHDVHEEDNVPPAPLVDILYESVRPPVLELPPAHLQRCHWARGMRAEPKQQETDVHNNYVCRDCRPVLPRSIDPLVVQLLAEVRPRLLRVRATAAPAAHEIQYARPFLL